jgi:cobalt-zinc-cadmium efflux system membrane fusion protein
MNNIARLHVVLALFAVVIAGASCERQSRSHDAHHHGGHDDHGGDHHAHELQHTEILPDAARTAGIETSIAGPGRIDQTLTVYGQLTLNENKVVHVMPRFPGVAKEIKKQLGDTVAPGELLAVIESNHNLQPYEIRSQIAGTVIKRHLAKGEFAPEGQDIFVVADLNELWADFRVYRKDFQKVHVGQKVLVHVSEGSAPLRGEVSYLSPFGEEATQTRIVRVVVPNPNGALYPGLFITGDLVTGADEVPVAVPAGAVQSLHGHKVVFVKEGDTYHAREVRLGRSDGETHEIRSGLKAGERYVSKNSFTVKADILKAGATHDH